jgi:hypothetical protein
MWEEVPRFLEVSLKFEDERGEKMGQEGFYGVPDLGNIKNPCVGQGKRAVKNVSVRSWKGPQAVLPNVLQP